MNRCEATVSLRGETIQCSVVWADEDHSIQHRAGLHSGEVNDDSGKAIAVMWEGRSLPERGN